MLACIGMTNTKQICYETNDQSKVESKHLNKHIEWHIERVERTLYFRE